MKIHFKNFRSTIETNYESLSNIHLHGSNLSEIKEKCDEAIELLCGPTGQVEMRVIKLPESIILKDPDRLYTAIKTISFFPGKQVVIIEGATDKITKILGNTFKNWAPNDAILILISGTIKPTSPLRKMLESNPTSISTAVYDEQRNIVKIEEIVNSAKVKILDQGVASFLKNPKNFSSTQEFVLFMEKLEAYKFSDQSPVTFKDIDLLFTEQHNLDEFKMLACLADGDIENMIELLRILFASGLKPNKILNSTSKHFVLLHKLSLNRQNPDFVLNRSFPPLFGIKRHLIVKHSETWSTQMTERALDIIIQLEKKMRSSQLIEVNSLLERALLRIVSLRTTLN